MSGVTTETAAGFVLRFQLTMMVGGTAMDALGAVITGAAIVFITAGEKQCGPERQGGKGHGAE